MSPAERVPVEGLGITRTFKIRKPHRFARARPITPCLLGEGDGSGRTQQEPHSEIPLKACEKPRGIRVEPRSRFRRVAPQRANSSMHPRFPANPEPGAARWKERVPPPAGQWLAPNATHHPPGQSGNWPALRGGRRSAQSSITMVIEFGPPLRGGLPQNA